MSKSRTAIAFPAIQLLTAACCIALLFFLSAERASCQVMTFDEIRNVFLNNPPTTGDPVLREEAILNLDEHLKTSAGTDTEAFYRHMTGRLAYELSLTVPNGARIWQMYNHGYIVKTPSSVFAFDLTEHFFNVPLANEVLQQIDVLFTSHRHNDHRDPDVQNGVASFGGELVTYENIPLETKVAIGGLDVVAYDGPHSDTNNIYHVTTPEGFTIMHTGDSHAFYNIPYGTTTDILLINAWVGPDAMRTVMNNVSPKVSIPGHIQELGHALESRATYEETLVVDDVPIPGVLKVMAWGEHLDYGVAAVDALPKTAIMPPSGNLTAFDRNNDGQGDFGASRLFAYVGEVDAATNRMDRQIAKFDLPNLSQSKAMVKSAKLRFYLEDIVGVPAGPVSLLHSLTDNSLNGLGQQYQDSTYVDTLIDVVQPSDTPGQYYEVDVTDQVLADYAAEGRLAAFSAFRLQINEAVWFEDGQSNYYAFRPPARRDHQPLLVITFVPEPSTGMSLGIAFLLLGGWFKTGRQRPAQFAA